MAREPIQSTMLMEPQPSGGATSDGLKRDPSRERSVPEFAPASKSPSVEDVRIPDRRTVAYFSMEIGLVADIPTYAGGLGVLAGDTVRAAADLHVPMVAVTLLHRKGYFRQVLDGSGHQTAEPVNWVVSDFLTELPARASVTIEQRTVQLRAWTFEVAGLDGYKVPVLFLDSHLPENNEADRTLTDLLYGGDPRYRLCQEIILGIGGVRMLRTLGHEGIERFHINEGHAGLLTVELLRQTMQQGGKKEFSAADVENVRHRCAFTTHTPVPAGHDRFPHEMVASVLDAESVDLLRKLHDLDGSLNMTHLALHLSLHTNGVSRRHGEVSRRLFAPHPIGAITNGIHAPTWATLALQEVFDRFTPGWRSDSFALRHALKIPNEKIWPAHRHAKRRLLEFVNRETNAGMHVDTFTIGFARRAALYKRADLLFDNLERLLRIHADFPIQLVYAGKAHPHDQGAKELIRKILQVRDRLKNQIRLIYLENYDIRICRLMVAGVDLWLNTPEPPLEASGTSGMKAALNGVPSLSVLDGWWVEGCIENFTGWSIGKDEYALGISHDRPRAADEVYNKLEYVILPLFYQQRDRYIGVMKNCIATNGSYFSTHRMMHEYVTNAYLV